MYDKYGPRYKMIKLVTWHLNDLTILLSITVVQ